MPAPLTMPLQWQRRADSYQALVSGDGRLLSSTQMRIYSHWADLHQQPRAARDGQPLLLHAQRGGVNHLVVYHQRAHPLIAVRAGVGLHDALGAGDFLLGRA